MQPLRHSYTNRTLGDGATVVKRYQGPDALARAQREHAALQALHGRIPVPLVLSSADRCLTMTFMSGVHGQELLEAGEASGAGEAGHGRGVLRACGTMLRRIHQLGAAEIKSVEPRITAHLRAANRTSTPITGHVLVHGDYGPNNVLLDPATLEISAVLDWEWAHAGEPVEDLAWCEWIVRMHHPAQMSLLGVFFDAYGGVIPPWPDRQAVMLGRCQSLLDLCHRQEPGGPGETQWRHRFAVTSAWHE
jgi:aminoglycoside phosphotransferase